MGGRRVAVGGEGRQVGMQEAGVHKLNIRYGDNFR